MLGPGAWCLPARTTLPNGTTFEVGSPNTRLVCEPVRHHSRDRRSNDTTTVSVTNEFNPTGSAGPTPVSLAVGPIRSTCALLPTRHAGTQFSRSHATSRAVPLATFSCSSANYPSKNAVRFAPPSSVKVGDRLELRVLDPSRLCTPTSAPGVAAAATSTAQVLVCFDMRLANRSRWFTPDLNLCVPSSLGTSAPPANTTTTSSTATTSTTTTSTTTTTGGPQPCPGVIINGVCVIPL